MATSTFNVTPETLGIVGFPLPLEQVGGVQVDDVISANGYDFRVTKIDGKTIYLLPLLNLNIKVNLPLCAE
jgi:hypothetical protein